MGSARRAWAKPDRFALSWRLLEDGAADGAWNMAVDEAIAMAVGDGLAPATLRLYGWGSPTVSLGYLQKSPGGVDLGACGARGIAVVRRVTGGRAVLHAAELTYSVAVPLQGPWRALSVAETFTLFSRGLMAGLARLGLAAEMGEAARGAGSREAAACFLVRGMPAILVGGRKLIGSAQRRWDRALLQHGSLLLDFDPHLHQVVFPAWSRTDPAAGITSLRSLLGRLPGNGEVASTLAAGWGEALGGACVPGVLSLQELRAAAALAEARYRCPGWTFHR
jgi:lipoate-protein ligase A